MNTVQAVCAREHRSRRERATESAADGEGRGGGPRLPAPFGSFWALPRRRDAARARVWGGASVRCLREH